MGCASASETASAKVVIGVGAAIKTAATKAKVTVMKERGQSQPNNSFSSLLLQACLRYHWEAQFRSCRRSNRKRPQAKARCLPSDINQRLQQLRSKRQEEADGYLTLRVPTNSYETPSREAPTPLLFSKHVTLTYEIQAESPRVT